MDGYGIGEDLPGSWNSACKKLEQKWHAYVYVTKSWTQLSYWTELMCMWNSLCLDFVDYEELCNEQKTNSIYWGIQSVQLMSIELVMPSNHLTLCHSLLLPSVFASIRVFSSESFLCITWPKYWSFSSSISPSNEFPGLISWFDLLAVQRTLNQESSPTPQFKSINSKKKRKKKSINSLALIFLYRPTLIYIHDSWKNHRCD